MPSGSIRIFRTRQYNFHLFSKTVENCETAIVLNKYRVSERGRRAARPRTRDQRAERDGDRPAAPPILRIATVN